MRRLLAVLGVLAGGMAGAPAATADTLPVPPYIDHATWVSDDGLSSLRLYPTAAGRAVAGDFGKTGAQADEAWREVLALVPGANSPGMRSQFVCHWDFAEFAQPGKTSWDLEPWRPVVDDGVMMAAGCNPGGAERF